MSQFLDIKSWIVQYTVGTGIGIFAFGFTPRCYTFWHNHGEAWIIRKFSKRKVQSDDEPPEGDQTGFKPPKP